MQFDFWNIISIFIGVFLAILLFYLTEIIRKNKTKPIDDAQMQRIALAEGVIWLAPVINFLQKCVLLAEDFNNGQISDSALIKAWPKINLKELETEKGKESMPWLPSEVFHRGMELIAQLDYCQPLFPEALFTSFDSKEDGTSNIHGHIDRLRTLLIDFQTFDRELRILISKFH
ncbi:MAG: hypothetical protein A2W94_01560 [Bacteroidetes bacterium GWE2_42_42]|nr:MAG: hypothetical protein A2W94_01560 [Bacteroidetes bacterium GWE2_42_42]HCB62658.1 hypothetical protein [Bacteroidales bacterium]